MWANPSCLSYAVSYTSYSSKTSCCSSVPRRVRANGLGSCAWEGIKTSYASPFFLYIIKQSLLQFQSNVERQLEERQELWQGVGLNSWWSHSSSNQLSECYWKSFGLVDAGLSRNLKVATGRPGFSKRTSLLPLELETVFIRCYSVFALLRKELIQQQVFFRKSTSVSHLLSL